MDVLKTCLESLAAHGGGVERNKIARDGIRRGKMSAATSGDASDSTALMLQTRVMSPGSPDTEGMLLESELL